MLIFFVGFFGDIIKYQDDHARMRINDSLALFNWAILVPRGRAPFGQHQESVLTKRSAACGDENAFARASGKRIAFSSYVSPKSYFP